MQPAPVLTKYLISLTALYQVQANSADVKMLLYYSRLVPPGLNALIKPGTSQQPSILNLGTLLTYGVEA